NGSRILITGPLCAANGMGMGGYKNLEFWQLAGSARATITGFDAGGGVVRFHAILAEGVGVPLTEDWEEEGLKKGEKYIQLHKGTALKFILKPETLIELQ
ncbi:MAG: hypothetical protein RLZZ283_306, partial [Candidatus Parcubacteria bacterium]